MSDREQNTNGRTLPLGALTVFCLLAAALLLAPTASAGQTHLFEGTFCAPTGLGTPPCEPTFGKAYSLAVHEPGGEVIVLDASAATILRFKANGEPEPFSALGANAIDGKLGPGEKPCAEEPASCDATPENGLTFSSSFAQEAQIAVDSSGTATDGNIYVTQKGSGLHLVDIFDSTGTYRGQLTGTVEGPFGANSRPAGVAVAPNGNVFVSDFGFIDPEGERIYKYVPSANPPVNADGSVFSSAVDNAGRLAAGAGPSAGALFASTRFGPTYKLGSGGAIECKVHDGGTLAVAVNPDDGHVLVSGQAQGGVGVSAISEYDASDCEQGVKLTPIARFDGARRDIAVEESGGRVYATADANEDFPSRVEVYGPLVPLPVAITGDTTNIGETTATVNGTVEAFGEELTECKFEYGTTTAYGSSKPCAGSLAEIGTSGEVPVQADLTGLSPETLYHYRLVVANPNGPGDPQGEDRTFQTVSKPELLGVWSEDVTLTEATLKAQINPQSANTTYRFEWGLAAGPPYENTSAEVSIGSEPVPQTVSLLLSGLQPGTTYHYRVVASNKCHPASDPGTTCTSESADLTFTTFLSVSPDTECENQDFRIEASAFLPDCRAYEMVSPLDKNGGNIVRGSITPTDPDGFTQAAPDGESITYTSLSGFGELEAGVNFNQYLASRGGGAWASRGIRPPVEGREVDFENDTFNAFRAFLAFTPDLCYGWLIDYQTPPLTEEAIDGYPNLYRRDNCEPGEGELEAVTDVEPPAGTPQAHISRHRSVVGVSADGRHVFFVSQAKLTETAPAGNEAKLYDRFEGGIYLVSVQLNGNGSVGTLGGGSWIRNLASAVSEDGSRVYWNNGARLFLRINPEQPQSALAAGNKCTEPDKACTVAVSAAGAGGYFWAASSDGAKAIYTQGGLESGEAKLFEFDLARLEAGEAASRPIAEGVFGVAGASRDVERVYFVSRKALAGAGPNGEGEEATEGAPNLYLQETEGGAASFAFVGALSEKDVGEKEPGAEEFPYDVASQSPYLRATRVSADGGAIAFNSRAPLTGYDNTDAASGKAAVEVFVYSAGSGELSCASCNPSGARPQVRASMKIPYQFPWDDLRSTNVPAAAWLPTWEQPTVASRPLSDSGARLFFNSYDALLPRDTNGEMDVYEWEAPGEGSCEEGDPDYFERNGGCIYLISSGESSYESEFWEASADGEDVFFTTESDLVPPDPGSVDLYDARAGGGFSYPAPRASCEGEACQSPDPAPEAKTPSSSTYHGPGNAAAPGPGCAAHAKRARRLSRSARALRRRAAARGPRRAQALRRRARRLRSASRRRAVAAKRNANRAKRCRRQARRAAR